MSNHFRSYKSNNKRAFPRYNQDNQNQYLVPQKISRGVNIRDDHPIIINKINDHFQYQNIYPHSSLSENPKKRKLSNNDHFSDQISSSNPSYLLSGQISKISQCFQEEEFVFLDNEIVKKKPAISSGQHKRKFNESFDNGLISRSGDATTSLMMGVFSQRQMVNIYGIPTSLYEQQTSDELWQYFLDNGQTEATYRSKVQLRNSLLNMMSYVFENAGLFIVGSSMNGFGGLNSDMDISLTITNQELHQKKEAFAVLSELMGPLRKCGFLEEFQLIKATVPILKFRDKIAKIECDLNVNNIDGIYNTHLLAMYNRVDWRLQPLGVFLKKWAQRLDIHDASKGRLSSYTLMLMLIQYLQGGCEPPVLPSLQARYPLHFSYQRHLGEVNLCRELPWHEIQSSNQSSLCDLLMGFFEYYVERFDFERMAVSVRTGRPIPMQVAVDQYQTQTQTTNMRPVKLFVEEPFSLLNVSRSLYDETIFPRIKRCLRHSMQVLRMRQPFETMFLVPEPTDASMDNQELFLSVTNDPSNDQCATLNIDQSQSTNGYQEKVVNGEVYIDLDDDE